MIVLEDLFTGIAQPLTHPRIGWHREPGTVTATNSAAGFDAAFADNPTTYTAWSPSADPAEWRMTFAAAASPSYIGIIARDVATVGATLTVRKLVGATWSDWGNGTTITPETNDAVLFLLEPQEVDGIGISVTGGLPKIINIRAGDVMEWPRLATWTGLPITESKQFRYNVNESDTGNWLGRSRVAQGLSFDFQVDHLSEHYRRNDFAAFAAHCNEGDATFWIAHRPDGYPEEVAYAWSPDKVEAERQQPNKDIANSVGLSLQGYLAP